MKHFDMAIIGGGAGGLVVAAVASQLGHKVVLFEKHKMGGDCLNYGCVPSKSILAASKAVHNIVDAAKFGISAKAGTNFAKVQQHVQNVIAEIEPHDSVERFEGLGAIVIKGEAQFTDKNTVECAGEHYTAKRFVIATGSSPLVPPINNLDKIPYLTNETIWELKECPHHLIIIGGGPIGCEMAQNYRRLGAEVTIIEASHQFLTKEEPEIGQMLSELLAQEGITIHLSTHIEEIQQKGKDIILAITQNGRTFEVQGSHVLVAAGRKANVQGLELEKAGVRYNERHIEVNKAMQTSNKAIYAVGDVAGPYQFTHMASYQASIVIGRLLFGNIFAKADYNAIPWCTYTDPELAHVGLTEKEALQQYGKKYIRTITLPFGKTDRAKAERKETGMIKVTFGKKGRILGATILGYMAGELIQQWTILISHKMCIKDLLKVIYPYPTFSEINRQIASEYYKNSFYSSKTGKISQFLFKFLG